MVVGDDIAVRADDDAGAAALARRGLSAIAAAAVGILTEEIAEEVVHRRRGRRLAGLDGHLDIDHRLDGILGGIGEIGIVRQ